jgi:hypothetical protein
MRKARITGPPRRRLFALLAAIGCLAAISACGSSDPNKTAASAHSGDALKFSECMRSHGVANFPDPSSGGGGFHIHIGPGSGINPFSPAFRAARAACGKLLPGGGPGNGPPSAQAKAHLLAISECMRSHGLTDFPDPTTTPPSSPNQYGLVLNQGGVFLAVPNAVNTQSPAFKQAATACHFGGP